VSGIAIQFAVFLALGIGAGILIQTRFGSPNRLGRRCERSISTQEEKLNAS
jgi:hypothetical protein